VRRWTFARFAALTAQSLAVLTTWGYVLGGIAILAAAFRAVIAGDRNLDFVRILLVALALGLATYEQRGDRTGDGRDEPTCAAAAYHDLHGRSTQVYGVVVLLTLVTLVLAAVRRDD